MVHKLILIAGIGLGASSICVGAAAAFGGGDDGFSLFDSRPTCEASPGATATAREMNWDGSDHAALNFSGHASYTPGSGDMLRASGDPQVLAHLRVRHGTVELDCRGWRDRTRDVTVTLPGRALEKFDVIGGQLTLDKLNQPSLEVAIAGSGKVQVNGRIGEAKLSIAGSGTIDADQLAVTRAKAEIAGSGTIHGKGVIDDLGIKIAGSGHVDFGRATSRTARVEIAGHGDVDIAPTERADISIGGSGDVTLHSDPREMETHIGGSGRIHKVAAGG
jgi:hypothetical protein